MNTAVQTLKAQLENKRAEKRRLEEALYRVQGYIAALESSLEVVGSSRKTSRRLVVTDAATVNPLEGLRSVITEFRQQPKLHDLAYVVLKESGKPLTGDQIIPLMHARGCISSKQSILGAIYRAAKDKDRFVANRGVFSLKEWQSEHDRRIQELSELREELRN